MHFGGVRDGRHSDLLGGYHVDEYEYDDDDDDMGDNGMGGHYIEVEMTGGMMVHPPSTSEDDAFVLPTSAELGMLVSRLIELDEEEGGEGEGMDDDGGNDDGTTTTVRRRRRQR